MNVNLFARESGGGRTINRRRIPVLVLVMAACILAASVVMISRNQTAQAAAIAGDWSTYLGDQNHSGFNRAEKIINPTSAPNLKLHWSAQAGGYIYVNNVTDQPVEANGMVYWGSWDGNEHAMNLSGTQVWDTGLGYTYSSVCDTLVGIAGTPTVATIKIGGTATPVLYVGGGNVNFYALNANTGAIIWSTPLGTQPDNFIWSSPALFKGSIYIGLSSLGDCPLVQGKFFKLDAQTGAIQQVFNVVPDGCTGGSVWGSPTIDTAAGTVYFATGNDGSCSSTEPYATSLVELNASNLAYVGSWKVPVAQQIVDSDFGSTPTLFNASIGGQNTPLVGIANKNGMYYTFVRGSISNGPIWSVQIATLGGGCGPNCGDGSISPSAWNGATLFVAGGQTTIKGVSCKGSLDALNPATGAFKWQHCLNDGPVLGAVSGAPGLVVVGEGNTMVIVATTNGHTLFTYTDSSSNSLFYGAASISNGVLYIGNYDGYLYAIGI